MIDRTIEDWFGTRLEPGCSYDLTLPVSESYSGFKIDIPVHIKRAAEPGPTVFITAAIHGDEINGTGTIHQLLQDEEFRIGKGALILVPVLNILAFDRHSRYLPDRRDLNRSFPGSPDGSLAARMAHTIFQEIVGRCDYGIDLHTASIRRTNYPNIRGDLNAPGVMKIAGFSGSEIIIESEGPKGGLRREACKAGCPTVIYEGGEIWKVEPGIVSAALRGIKNILHGLGMLEGEMERPGYQVFIRDSKWIRAEHGGFMQFHIAPGDIIEKGQPIATITTLLGDERNIIYAPFNSVVIGMTTLPAISPGEPICHIGRLPDEFTVPKLTKLRTAENGLEQQLTEELSSNILVVESPPEQGVES